MTISSRTSVGDGPPACVRLWVDRRNGPNQEHEADHVVTDVLQAMEIMHGEG
ncbi:hypothetical protein [Microbispora bryophytorum]|uniref:hypothetical protein n=1 Tax=Microbispora bryophytorum TaxID=1460882 RepID=UPI0037130309